MNSFVNVQVRVLAAQAQSQLAALNSRIGALEGSFGRANRAAGLFGSGLSGLRLDAFGSRLQWIGRQLEYNFTLPILAAAGASVKFALDNEAAFTRVTKVYGDAAHGADFYAQEIEALKKNFVALSNVYGIHQKETIEIAAGWAAAGASGIALAKSVDLTMQTMILGEMKAAEATEALIAIQAQYGFSVEELTNTIATLNMVENQTGISLKGLVEGFARAAGVARSAGVDYRHLAAMLAALVPAAGSATQAGNALKTIFSRLMSPTKEMVEVLDLMGISISDMSWKSASVTDRLGILAKKFDGLSDAQKGVVSSVAASRWQINKFEILMRSLIDQNGYYQRALDATADKTKIFAQMTRELNTVLSSNPRRLQIMWTILQNAAADIVQPLIPLLLYLAAAVAKLASAFANLDPGIQKLVLSLVLFVALIGPLVRLHGAFILLFSHLSMGLGLVLAPIHAVTAALWTLIRVPVVAFLTAIGTAIRTGILALAAVGPMLGVVMARIQTALLAGAATAGVVWRAGFGVITTITMGVMTAVQVIVAQTMFALQGILIAGAAALGRAWRAGLGVLLAVQKAWGMLMAVNFRQIFAMLIALAAAGFVRLRALFLAFIPTVRAFSMAVLVALTGPWGIAIGIVVALLLAFWDEVKAIWSAMVRGTIAAFNALPAGIRNAMLAVVRVVRSAVMAVYNLLSYLNPWARHSPSLVENVTTGVAEIKKQYSSLSSIGDIFRRAGLSLAEFSRAVLKVRQAAEAQEIAELRENLSGIAADAVPAFNRLVSVLGPLRNLLSSIKSQIDAQQAVVDRWRARLDAATAALERQQKVLDGLQDIADRYRKQLDSAQDELDRFASAPIKGMKKIEDAIFNTEMQQKRLRLEMMKMEEAIGPLDQLQSRIDTLNGGIELLSGQQAELRNAGAGSEILKYYDDQIDLLEQQKKEIKDQVAPLQNLSDQIDELGRKATMLDLEKSLKFDPLKRQIDDVVNAMQEMPFEQILAGVIKNKAEVDRLSAAYERANEAVERQKAVVDRLQAARDAVQAGYDAESSKLQKLQDEYSKVEEKIREIEQALRDVNQAAQALKGGAGSMSPGAENFLASAGGNFPDVGGLGDIGREGGLADQSKLIDDFTKEMADKTKNMFGLFNFLDPIKKAWNTAWGWVKENVGGILSEVGSSISAGVAEFGNPFGDMSGWTDTLKDVGKTIKTVFKTIWDFIGPDVIKIAKEAWAGLQDAFKDIQPEIEKFRDLVGPMGEALKNIWTMIKPGIMVALGLILLLVKAVLGAIGGAIGPLFRAIGELVKGIIKIIRGIIEFVVGVFTGDWKMAWEGIKDIFTGAWDAIWGVVKNLGNAIWGLVKGFVMGIIDFFKMLYDKLVGHSIVPDIVNGIIDWFTKMVNFGKSLWNALGNAIKWAYENIIKPIIDKFRQGIEGWKLIFNAVVEAIKSYWNSLVDKFRSAWATLNGIIASIRSALGTISSFWAGVVNTVLTYINRLVGYFSTLRSRFSFSGLFDGLTGAFRSAVNWIIGKWNSLSFGVGPFAVGTPDIPYMARGGMIANRAMAVVGEGRKGYPEYVIPTDPMYRKRAIELFAELGKALDMQGVFERATVFNALDAYSAPGRTDRVQFYASGGTIGSTVRRSLRTGNALVIAPTSTTEYHFHGNLEFPNVKDGSDAEEFLRNLEALISEA